MEAGSRERLRTSRKRQDHHSRRKSCRSQMQPVCGQHGLIVSQDLIVSTTMGVSNAIVRLTNITAGRPASDVVAPVLDQKRRRQNSTLTMGSSPAGVAP